MKKNIMIIAGEASGDIHAAKLVKAMQKRDKTLSFCGIGGDALRNAGVRILVDASTLSVVGITEVFSKISGIFKGISTVKRHLRTQPPDLLILIDFPDFNLHIAETAKRLGIPIFYYISPQIWAWRSGRVKKIGRLVDHIAVILPFEAAYYRKHDIPVTYVGHPLLDSETPDRQQTTDNRQQMTDDRRQMTDDGQQTTDNRQQTIVGLLPGSRDGEIAKLLPIMLKTAHKMTQKHEDIKFIIPVAPSVKKETVEEMINAHFTPNRQLFSTVSSVEEAFKKCSLVIAASGTVTLEAAIAGVPMIVVYKVSPLSYLIGRSMIQVRHICLANLIGGKEIVPELIQDEASPENIAAAASNLINDASGLQRMRSELLSVRNLLGGPGASERAADIAIEMLK